MKNHRNLIRYFTRGLKIETRNAIYLHQPRFFIKLKTQNEIEDLINNQDINLWNSEPYKVIESLYK